MKTTPIKELPPFHWKPFLATMFSRSGIPYLNDIADIILFTNCRSHRDLIYKDKYRCTKEGLSKFYNDKLHSVDFLNSLPVVSDDPVADCEKTEKEFKRYKNVFKELYELKADDRSPSEIAENFYKKYPKISKYLIDNISKSTLDYIIKLTKRTKYDYIKTFVIEKFGEIPSEEDFEVFKKFFKGRTCKSLKPTGILSRLKNKIGASLSVIGMVDFCSEKAQHAARLTMDITHNIEKILGILFHVTTGGGVIVVKGLLYGGLILFNLYKAYKFAKKGDGKEMSIRLGKAVGFAIKLLLPS